MPCQMRVTIGCKWVRDSRSYEAIGYGSGLNEPQRLKLEAGDVPDLGFRLRLPKSFAFISEF